MSITLGKKSDVKEVKEFQSQYLPWGFNLIKFNKFELKVNKTGSVSLMCHIEGKPRGEKFTGFKYENGTFAKGLISGVQLGYAFQKDEPSKILHSLTVLATEMGFTDEEMEAPADTLEELLDNFITLVKDKYAWVMLKGKEYINKKGAVAVIADSLWEEYAGKDGSGNAMFQLFCKAEDFKETIKKDDDGNIIELVGVFKSGEKIGAKMTRKFDKTSQYHYAALEAEKADEESDDEMMEEIETDEF